MWTDLAAWALRFAPFGLVSGLCFALAGLIGIIAFRRSEVTMGPVPRKLAAPPAVVLPRADSDTGVVARIPGATPEAGSTDLETDQVNRGPVCPTCGGPFGNCQCYSQKERTEEAVALPALAPQFAALDRFFAAVDQATEELAATAVLVRDGSTTAVAEVDEAILRRVSDGLREPEPEDDCPLTTREIPTLAVPLAVDSPAWHEASARLGDTRELSSALLEKVKQA